MLTLNYYVEISATPQRVWEVLTDAELYKRWAQAFSPQSQFDGTWEEGQDIIFLIPIWAERERLSISCNRNSALNFITLPFLIRIIGSNWMEI